MPLDLFAEEENKPLDLFSDEKPKARSLDFGPRLEPVPPGAIENPNLYGFYGAGKALMKQVVEPTLDTLGMLGGAAATGMSPLGGALGYGMGRQAGRDLTRKYEGLWEEPKPYYLGNEVLQGAVDVGMAYTLGKASELAAKGAGAVEDKISKVIREGMGKGIRPSLTQGKARNIGKVDEYYAKAESAVGDIIKNKGNLTDKEGNPLGRLPRNVEEFANSIDQTKSGILKEYNAMAAQAKEKGAGVDLNKIANVLDEVATDKSLQLANPEASAWAAKRAGEFRNQGVVDPLVAQDTLTKLNAKTRGFFSSPTVPDANVLAIEVGIANNLRTLLNNTINKSVGGNYQALKNKWGSLATIEEDVNKRLFAEIKKNSPYLIDLSNVFTSYEMVSGLMKKDYQKLAAGGFARVLTGVYRWMKDPNRQVNIMFKDAERLFEQQERQINKIRSKIPSATQQFGTKQLTMGSMQTPPPASVRPMPYGGVAPIENFPPSPNLMKMGPRAVPYGLLEAPKYRLPMEDIAPPAPLIVRQPGPLQAPRIRRPEDIY